MIYIPPAVRVKLQSP